MLLLTQEDDIKKNHIVQQKKDVFSKYFINHEHIRRYKVYNVIIILININD